MAFVHGKNTTVLVADGNLSPYFNSSDVSEETETHDVTVFGQNAKNYQPGLDDGSASFEGFWDGAAGAVDEVLRSYLGTASGQVVTIAENGTTVGNRVKMLSSRLTTYAVTNSVGDMVAISAEMQADGGVDSGVSLRALGVGSAGTETGSSVDNTTSSSNGGVAHLHVTAAGTSVAAKIQHSADNTVWVDLVTFTAIGAAKGSERKEVAAGTTVNRYLRAVTTIGGNPTFAVAFARR